MRTLFLVVSVALIAGMSTASCRKSKPADRQTTLHPDTTQQSNDELIEATFISKVGVQLAMRYNNTTRTARFILKKDTIALKQDTVASGIRYSNRTYVYTEHQGQGTLKKDGKIIFQSAQ